MGADFSPALRVLAAAEVIDEDFALHHKAGLKFAVAVTDQAAEGWGNFSCGNDHAGFPETAGAFHFLPAADFDQQFFVEFHRATKRDE